MAQSGYLRGVFVVVPTPLNDDESLDSKGLQHLINYYIESGCHGLLILGSGGEFPYFTLAERNQIVRTAVKAVKGRVPLLAGAGFFSEAETMVFIKEAGSSKIDGFLVIVPTYYPVSFEAVFTFYSRVSRESKRPILYYHYPQQTGLFFSPEQLAAILKLENVVGMKDSVLSVPGIKKHIDLVREWDVSVFSGNALAMKKILRGGGDGVIAVLPSVAPRLVVDCYHACRDELKEAADLQKRILNLLPLLNTFELPVYVQTGGFKILSSLPISMKGRNPSKTAIIKETLRQLGHPITARVRSPQPQLREREKKSISALIEKNNLTL